MKAKPSQPGPSHSRNAGFTLVELLVSMLILAIGIMATLSMQFASLDGAMSSRDNSNASDIAQRIMRVMRLEASQWRRGGIETDVQTAAFSGSAFERQPVLGAVRDAGAWTWRRLFAEPVDARLSTDGAARYCAYARGDYKAANEVFAVHVAVVFPAPNQSFPADGCPDYADNQLDPGLAADDTNSLQMQGYRVQYFGTHINRSGHLGPTAGGGAGAGAGG